MTIQEKNGRYLLISKFNDPIMTFDLTQPLSFSSFDDATAYLNQHPFLDENEEECQQLLDDEEYDVL